MKISNHLPHLEFTGLPESEYSHFTHSDPFLVNISLILHLLESFYSFHLEPLWLGAFLLCPPKPFPYFSLLCVIF